MKIKSKINVNAIKVGDIVEAIHNSVYDYYGAYDANGLYCTLSTGQFETVKEEENIKTNPQILE